MFPAITDGTHDGTFVGSVPPVNNFTNDTPHGLPGQSLDLRGSGNLAVRINNSRNADAGYQNTYDDGISTKFSVAFWAKGFPDQWNPWVSKYGENGRGWQFRRFGGDPVACFTVRGQPNDDGSGSTINVNDNNWHHFVGVWDGENGHRSLYVDGVLSHTITGGYRPDEPGARRAPGPWARRGDEGDNFGNWFKGQLYDVRMFNQALSGGDVQDVVGAGSSLRPPASPWSVLHPTPISSPSSCRPAWWPPARSM